MPTTSTYYEANTPSYTPYYIPTEAEQAERARHAHFSPPHVKLQSLPCASRADAATCSKKKYKSSCTAIGCQWNSEQRTCTPSSDPCKCPVLTKTINSSKCSAIKDNLLCSSTTGCYWDNELLQCYANPSVWHIVLACAVLVPISYLVGYYTGNKAHITRVWEAYPSFHTIYQFSVAFATLAMLYLLARVQLVDQYTDVRTDFAKPLVMIIVGAALVPLFRALYLHREYSIYWVFLALLTTSGGVAWFMSVYFKHANAKHDLGGILAIYVVLFHVLLMDNIGWWWLVFLDAGK